MLTTAVRPTYQGLSYAKTNDVGTAFRSTDYCMYSYFQQLSDVHVLLRALSPNFVAGSRGLRRHMDIEVSTPGQGFTVRIPPFTVSLGKL